MCFQSKLYKPHVFNQNTDSSTVNTVILSIILQKSLSYAAQETFIIYDDKN